MRLIERRDFLKTVLSAAPLAACAASSSLAGEPSAGRSPSGVLVRAGRDRFESPRSVLGGLRIDAKVPPEDTQGDLYVIEHSDEARGGPPRHLHHRQDEWFYVLEGTYRAEVGEAKFELGPGDSLFAPRKVPHVWAHTGEGRGRLIIAFQPAGLMESFFAALSQLQGTPSPDELRPLFAAHGMTVAGPPLPV
jgi:mannose-6-phosphate isomerase-like protein (cupin superfamily)